MPINQLPQVFCQNKYNASVAGFQNFCGVTANRIAGRSPHWARTNKRKKCEPRLVQHFSRGYRSTGLSVQEIYGRTMFKYGATSTAQLLIIAYRFFLPSATI